MPRRRLAKKAYLEFLRDAPSIDGKTPSTGISTHPRSNNHNRLLKSKEVPTAVILRPKKERNLDQDTFETLASQVRKLLPDAWVRRERNSVVAWKRQRKVGIVALFWSVLLGCAVSK